MKYFWCLFVIAFATQASAQVVAPLTCFSCVNCDAVANPGTITCVHPPVVQPTQPPTAPPGPPPTEPPATAPPFPPPPGNPTPPGLPGLTPSPPATAPPPPPVDPPATPITPPLPPNLTPSTVAPPDQPVTDDPNAPTFTPAHSKKRRSVEQIDPQSAAHFSCFRNRVTVGTTSVVNRGCVANGGNNEQTCARTVPGAAVPTECSLCSSNQCNSASGLISSMFLIFATIFIALRLY